MRSGSDLNGLLPVCHSLYFIFTNQLLTKSAYTEVVSATTFVAVRTLVGFPSVAFFSKFYSTSEVKCFLSQPPASGY